MCVKRVGNLPGHIGLISENHPGIIVEIHSAGATAAPFLSPILTETQRDYCYLKGVRDEVFTERRTIVDKEKIIGWNGWAISGDFCEKGEFGLEGFGRFLG
ncbi:hypothetical protein Adt_28019 [Abeliophyllum distichum]|uniref:Uncharacterized protein n=1 Tax=Abeliophyllum distichum TaxID=126358 RepID=A0ABD1RW35_9LAMI